LLEEKIEGDFAAHAESVGCLTYKLLPAGRRGKPDRLVICPGFMFFIEFKKPDEVPEDHQAREHKRLRDLGHVVWVIDQPGEAEEKLDAILEATSDLRA
jgi:hypothetical protein